VWGGIGLRWYLRRQRSRFPEGMNGRYRH
jgi:hypothetical protein